MTGTVTKMKRGRGELRVHDPVVRGGGGGRYVANNEDDVTIKTIHNNI